MNNWLNIIIDSCGQVEFKYYIIELGNIEIMSSQPKHNDFIIVTTHTNSILKIWQTQVDILDVAGYKHRDIADSIVSRRRDLALTESDKIW